MSIRDSWETYIDQYDDLAASCSAQVAQWVWTDGPHCEQEPLFWVRRGKRPGGRIEPPDTPTSGHFVTGLDAKGRVHIVRQFRELGHYETVFLYAGDGRHVLRFDVIESETRQQAGRLVSIALHHFSEGRLTRVESVGARAAPKTERFRYDGIRLAAVDASRDESPLLEERIEYDDLGELDRVTKVWPNGRERVQFSRPKAKRSIKALFGIVVDRIVEEAVLRIRRLEESGPFFALCLAYAPGEVDVLPPLLGLGTAAELKRWDASADALRWNPAEYGLFDVGALALDAPELRAACEAFERQRRGKGFAMTRELLLEAARRLGALDWSPHLAVTPDFCVFAVDLEGAHLQENLAALT